jgi:hypothetical protein
MLSLLLISPDIRPLAILLLPLISQLLSVLWWWRLIALDPPRSSSFPISVIIPAPPVLLEPSVRDPFIVPAATVPVTVPVVSSPARVYIVIETWYVTIITPSPVIIP